MAEAQFPLKTLGKIGAAVGTGAVSGAAGNAISRIPLTAQAQEVQNQLIKRVAELILPYVVGGIIDRDFGDEQAKSQEARMQDHDQAEAQKVGLIPGIIGGAIINPLLSNAIQNLKPILPEAQAQKVQTQSFKEAARDLIPILVREILDRVLGDEQAKAQEASMEDLIKLCQKMAAQMMAKN